MRSVAASVCFLSLFLGFGDPGTLRPKPVKAFSPRGSSLPPPPQVGFPLPPRVISVGEVVTGTLMSETISGGIRFPPVFEILYELTAPSDGTLVVSLDWDSFESIGLSAEGAAFSFFPDLDAANRRDTASDHGWDVPILGLLPSDSISMALCLSS